MKIGPYEVLGELGRGGMGVVFRVRTPEGGDAALKRLHKVDPGTFARFERERRLLASLGEEDGFVGLLDAGVAEQGAWLVMPFVPGGTLRKKLQAGPLGVEETIVLGEQLARALGRAHERGIVHRDVKPENVLFTAEGRALLGDLGLAKHFDRAAPGASQSQNLTREGTFKGTVGYVPPEQLEDSASAGPPADVFALGAVLHECLSGKPAFAGENVLELVAKQGSGTIEPIGRPGVPDWLQQLLRRALAPDPRRRFPDGAALARALRERGRSARGPARALVAGTAAGALLLGGTLLALGTATARTPARPAPTVLPAPADLPAPPALPVPPAPPLLATSPLAPPSASPALARSLLEQGREKYGRRDLDGAIADFSRAIELEPTLASAWEGRSVALWAKGDLDGGIANANRTIEIEPEFAGHYVNRATMRSHKGDLDGAIADCTRALELAPRLARAWSERGSERLKKGDAGGAIADCDRALELDAANATSWANRGAARVQKGEWAAGITDCDRALEIDPRIAGSWANRGAAHAHQGEWDLAISDCSEAIKLSPGNAQAWASRGWARRMKEDADGALVDLDRALEMEPRDAMSWANRGVVRAGKNDIEGAITDYERALTLEPKGELADQVRAFLDEARKRKKIAR